MTKTPLYECALRLSALLVQSCCWPVFNWTRAGMMHGGLTHRGKWALLSSTWHDKQRSGDELTVDVFHYSQPWPLINQTWIKVHTHAHKTWTFLHPCVFSLVTNTHSSPQTHIAPAGWWMWAGRGWLAGSEWGRITTLSAPRLHCCFDNDPCRIAGMPGCRRSNQSSPSVSLSVYFSQTSFSDLSLFWGLLCYLVSFSPSLLCHSLFFLLSWLTGLQVP